MPLSNEYLSKVAIGDCSDVYYVDAAVHDTPKFGAVYIIDDDQPAIIDTGAGKHIDRILDSLQTLDIERDDLAYILPTHVHLDHAGGAGELAEACPNAKVLIHDLGARHIIDPEQLVKGTKQAVGEEMWQRYGEPRPIPEAQVSTLEGGETLTLGTQSLHVHHAPGHAPHQVLFENPENDIVFAADAAGDWLPEPDRVKALSPPPDFHLEKCLEDIDLIRGLDPEILCYAHFGPTHTEDKLDRYEQTLTNWVEKIRAKREELEDDEAVCEYFAERNQVSQYWGEEKAYQGTKMNVMGVLLYLDQYETG